MDPITIPTTFNTVILSPRISRAAGKEIIMATILNELVAIPSGKNT